MFQRSVRALESVKWLILLDMGFIHRRTAVTHLLFLKGKKKKTYLCFKHAQMIMLEFDTVSGVLMLSVTPVALYRDEGSEEYD